MFGFLKKRLAVKIVFLMLVFGGVFFLMMYLYVRHTNRLRSQVQMQLIDVHGKTVIRNFSDNTYLQMALVSSNLPDLAKEIELLHQDPTITYASVYDSNRQLIVNDQSYQAAFAKSEADPQTKGFRFPDLASANRTPDGITTRFIVADSGERMFDLVREVKIKDQEQGLGWVRIGISLQTMDREIRQARDLGYGIIAVFGVLGLIIALTSYFFIIPPVNRLAAAARQISAGNFNLQVPVSSSDEIGLLTATFNDMVKNISGKTGQLESLIQSITEAIRLLTGTTSELLAISTEQAAGATEQAAIVQEVVSTTEEFAATANRIADTAGAVNDAASRTWDAAQQGKEFMENSVVGIEHIREQVDKATNQIVELARQAQAIGGVIDIIEDISENTNLLSLNAAIEAAGAGEAGKRFGVVAGEVRRLANNTLEATDSVRSMVESIRSSTSNMVMLAENEQKAVGQGVGSVRQMGEYFGHILELVETTRTASSEIGLITRQQSSANQQMVTSIQDVEKVAREVEKGVKKIESSVAEINHLAARLATLIGLEQKIGS
jgi:methyl-accepting chemotaxis protein